ncbi:MAG: serine hydroxymethyltransferase [Candidatus Altiarchaeota archaeon]
MTLESFYRELASVDEEVYNVIQDEIMRQEGVNMIASESYCSVAVREAVSCVMTNKYAEGYPHKRYYGGCEYVDAVEDLAIERAKKLFGVEHVNVQPHSGTQANMAVYFAALNPGDTILGMDLSHGGHLSHGYKVNFSGKIYHGETYTVSEKTQTIDPAEVLSVARKVKPKLIVCGYSAYPRIVDFKAFREIADEVGAVLMADIAHIAGLVAAGVHPNPAKHADYITTTTHKTLMGPRGALVMCREEYAKDLDKAVFPGAQGGPFMNVIAAKAVCFKENMSGERRKLQAQIVENARALASSLAENEFSLVSGGTDNHLMLVDLRGKGLTGKQAEEALNSSGITVNKNTIPFDPEKPFVTSGIRVGTPCVTIRGMMQGEMSELGGLMTEVVDGKGDEKIISGVRSRVSELSSRFPVYM